MKDENDRSREGTLPDDPEDDAEPYTPPGVKAAEDEKPEPVVPPIFASPFSTIAEQGIRLNESPPPRTWLLTLGEDDKGRPVGALPLGKVGVLAAGGGSGKTMALCQLALAVALGKRTDGTPAFWLDSFAVATSGRVLLALGEEDQEEVQRRLHRAANAMDYSDKEREQAASRIVALPLCGVACALTSKDRHGNTTTTPVLDALLQRLAEHEYSLVIVDPLSRFGSEGFETDNAVATRTMQALEQLVKVPGGPTVLAAHHSAAWSIKAKESNVRGATGIVDAARWVAVMDRVGRTGDSEVVKVRNPKSNYARRWDDQHIVLDAEGAFQKATDAQVKDAEEDARKQAEDAEDREIKKQRAAAAEENAKARVLHEQRLLNEKPKGPVSDWK